MIAHHLFDAQDLLYSEIANETNHLDHVLALDCISTLRQNPVGLEAFHLVEDDFALPIIRGEVISISNAEAAILPDSGCCLVLVGHDCVVRPRIIRDHVIHFFAEVQHHGSRRRIEASIDPVVYDTWQSYVLPPTEDVTLLCIVLQACPDIFNSKRSHTDDCNHIARHLGVVKLAEHAVPYLAIEDILTLVLNPLILRQATRIDGDGRVKVDLLILTRAIRFLTDQTEERRLRVVLVHLLVINDFNASYISVETNVWCHSILVTDLFEMNQQIISTWPRWHLRNFNAKVKLEMVGAKLGLQLRGWICIFYPSNTSNLIQPIVNNIIVAPLLEV
mmetsp:Transcript_253/g.432  ORF Transcript_253/g.432 Transcript_253/m.432 type:complete len:333 (+) Transcript_253:592-1590(+)